MDNTDDIKGRETAEVHEIPADETQETPATSPETRSRRSKRSDSKPPSAKSSTLLPSTPLHMTTRAASRAATGSAANSVASIESRRSSLAETASGNGSDQDDRPVQDSRRSVRNGASADVTSNDDDQLNDITGDERSSRSSRSSHDSPRKRKRESADVVDSGEATPKERRSDEADDLAAQTTPNEEPTPKRVARGRRRVLGLLAVQAPPYTPSDASAVNSPLLPQENGEASFGTAIGQAAEMPTKRLPGRRRAPHANVHIEADLRRQLSLKMGYRAIVKQLKPILTELAKRSIDRIDDEPDAYKESEHYQEVEDELRERLRSKLDQLRYQHLYAKEESALLLAGDREILEDTFSNRVRDLKADYEILAKYRILKALRANAVEVDADATEDEDGPIPAIRAPATAQNGAYVLPSRYDSRSRLFEETDRIWKDISVQRGISSRRKALIEGDDELTETEADLSGFATYEPADREAIVGARKRQALLEAVSTCAQRQTEDELAAEVESRKTKDGLDILAAASERRRLPTPSKPPPQQAPRTPKPAKGSQSRRGSLDENKHPADEPPVAPPSSKRRTSRTFRSRESSPAKHATPQQLNGAATPRMSSNKISDLLNNDQPPALPTIAESSPVTAWLPAPHAQPPRAIKMEADSGQRLQNALNGSTQPYQEHLHYAPGRDTINASNRTTETDGHQRTHSSDRRASDTAAVRPRIDIAQPASPTSNLAGSSKPTTFDGSGSTVSPTYTRQSPFHSRTSSLGARPGSYAQETRDTVIPPQMSGRRESQRDPYRPVSMDTLPPVPSRPDEDPYVRRTEPSTPVGRPYQPYAPQYVFFGGYGQPWQHVPLLPRTLPPRYPPLPAYGNETQQAGSEQRGPQDPPPPAPQEKDMWRHHSYSRGGKR